jgi:uncharacterized membrane protein YraQ (UPF0718 family)
MISWKIALARIVIAYFGAILVGMVVAKTPQGKAVEPSFAERQSKINFVLGDAEEKTPSFSS